MAVRRKGHSRTHQKGSRIVPSHNGTSDSCVETRQAKVSDATRVAKLSTELGYPVSPKRMAVLIKEVGRRPNQRLFVAVLSGNVVGWLEIFRPLSVLNAGKTEVGALVVDTEYRRCGVGTALMKKAHQWADENGSAFTYLRSNIARKDAHEFYKRSGYSIFKTQYVLRRISAKRKLKGL